MLNERLVGAKLLADRGHRLFEFHPADHALGSPLLRKVRPEMAKQKDNGDDKKDDGDVEKDALGDVLLHEATLLWVWEAFPSNGAPGLPVYQC